MLNIYKKGNNEWYGSVPAEQEATPYVPLWSSGDGYQTNNLLIYRTSSSTATTTGSYSAGGTTIIYETAVQDDTDWYDVTTGVWTPQVAGWWQVLVGGFFGGGGQNFENIMSVGGSVSSSVDSIGGQYGTLSAFGYFDGVTSTTQVSISTGNPADSDNPQSPEYSFFQALYLRP
jgi:hypothetical protein